MENAKCWCHRHLIWINRGSQLIQRFFRGAGLVLVSFLFAANVYAASAEQLLRDFFKNTHTLSAEFTQTVLDENMHPLDESRGEVWIKRPGKFRWDYEKPGKQQIISDGNKVWIYDVDLEQVTVKNYTKALGDAPAMLLAGSGDIDSRFRMTPMGSQRGLEWVQLQPVKSAGEFEQIQAGFEGDTLRALQLLDQFGQTTHIEFSDNRVNQKISDGKFDFTPPEGVDVFEADEGG